MVSDPLFWIMKRLRSLLAHPKSEVSSRSTRTDLVI